MQSLPGTGADRAPGRSQRGPVELRSHPSPACFRGGANAEQGWAWWRSASVAMRVGARWATDSSPGGTGSRGGGQGSSATGTHALGLLLSRGASWVPRDGLHTLAAGCTCSQLGQPKMSPDEGPVDENTVLHTPLEQLRGRQRGGSPARRHSHSADGTGPGPRVAAGPADRVRGSHQRLGRYDEQDTEQQDAVAGGGPRRPSFQART